MPFDLSTILLVLIAVVPGLFALRSRDQIVPRTFEHKGASAELAELVAMGFATHGILIALISSLLFLAGWLGKRSPDYFFAQADSLIAEKWWIHHGIEASFCAVCYIFFSFFVSHWLGFVYGISRFTNYFTQRFFAHADWLRRRFGITALLAARPIVYEVLNPSITDGIANAVYVEIEFKDKRGFYSGQVSQYAIVKDEEPHKPIVLIDVWYKPTRDSQYQSVDADCVMLDLADATVVQVKQMSDSDIRRSQATAPPASA